VQITEVVMSESRREIVEVGVLGKVDGTESEISEAMMRIRDCVVAM
jgi:hypothetical protein